MSQAHSRKKQASPRASSSWQVNAFFSKPSTLRAFYWRPGDEGGPAWRLLLLADVTSRPPGAASLGQRAGQRATPRQHPGTMRCATGGPIPGNRCMAWETAECQPQPGGAGRRAARHRHAGSESLQVGPAGWRAERQLACPGLWACGCEPAAGQAVGHGVCTALPAGMRANRPGVLLCPSVPCAMGTPRPPTSRGEAQRS